MSSKDPELIYIVGAGRSGSTVLSTILGNSDYIFNTGELEKLTRLGWLDKQVCSCGHEVNGCDFWDIVQQNWDYDPREYEALKKRFENSLFLLNPFKRKDDPCLKKYLDMSLDLLKVISEVSGKPIILDSSKSVVRGYLFQKYLSLKVSCIHLIRDGHSLAYSLSRQDHHQRPVFYVAWFWIFRNLAAKYFLNSFSVRYEDFCNNPRKTLEGISKFTDVDLGSVQEKIIKEQSFEPGHTVGGNRLRTSEKISLQYHDEWRHKLSVQKRYMFTVLSFPVLWYYGYLER